MLGSGHFGGRCAVSVWRSQHPTQGTTGRRRSVKTNELNRPRFEEFMAYAGTPASLERQRCGRLEQHCFGSLYSSHDIVNLRKGTTNARRYLPGPSGPGFLAFWVCGSKSC